MCLEQDLGKERVEERETEVMTEEIEAALEEVDAISRKFSLSWKGRRKKEANFDHTILRKEMKALIPKWMHKTHGKHFYP